MAFDYSDPIHLINCTTLPRTLHTSSDYQHFYQSQGDLLTSHPISYSLIFPCTLKCRSTNGNPGSKIGFGLGGVDLNSEDSQQSANPSSSEPWCRPARQSALTPPTFQPRPRVWPADIGSSISTLPDCLGGDQLAGGSQLSHIPSLVRCSTSLMVHLNSLIPTTFPLYLLGEHLSWPLPESSLSLGATVGESLLGLPRAKAAPCPLPRQRLPLTHLLGRYPVHLLDTLVFSSDTRRSNKSNPRKTLLDLNINQAQGWTPLGPKGHKWPQGGCLLCPSFLLSNFSL